MWTLHCIHTLAKNDLDIIWYESKLEVGWHLGFLFVEWGGLRGVMGWWGRLDRRLAMWVGGAGWLPGSNSSPLSGTIQRPQIPSWDPMPPLVYTYRQTHTNTEKIWTYSPPPPPLLKCLLLFLLIQHFPLPGTVAHVPKPEFMCL